MSDTTVASANRVQQWADDEFFEYVRINPLNFLMGPDENSVIQTKEELTKDVGDRVTFSLVSRLTGSGVVDDATLEGNEEALGNYGHQVTVHQIRNGVVVGKYEKIKTKIDLLAAAKTMLRLWNMEQLRDLFIARLLSPVTDGLTTYAAASEAQKDAWVVANNPDTTANTRILCGAALSNLAADHSSGLTNVDATSDDMHQDIVRLGKRRLQNCDPHVRPVVTTGKRPGKERFVHLMGSIPMRDLRANWETILSNADVRGEENALMSGGDLLIDNVACVEIPEMDRLNTAGGTTLANVGDGGTVEVQATFQCGAQALLLAWAQRMGVNMDDFDYKNKRGVAVDEIRGCEKSTFNSFQHGVGTVYVSAVGD